MNGLPSLILAGGFAILALVAWNRKQDRWFQWWAFLSLLNGLLAIYTVVAWSGS